MAARQLLKVNQEQIKELYARGCDLCGGNFKDPSEFNECECGRVVCNVCCHDNCDCGANLEDER
jgi:hypothetical protein